MINRGAIIAGLLIVFLFLVGNGIASWRLESFAVQGDFATDAGIAKAEQKEMAGMYPVPPSPLPDLHKGYLFNEERQLDVDAGQNEAAAGDSAGGIGFSEVMYSGSVIVGSVKKGIVVFSAADKKQNRGNGLVAGSSPGSESKQLAVGDLFLGYEVSEIYPERIVFTKDGESIEKQLFDPGKQRFNSQQLTKNVFSGGGQKKEMNTVQKDGSDEGAPKEMQSTAQQILRRQAIGEPIPPGLRIPSGTMKKLP